MFYKKMMKGLSLILVLLLVTPMCQAQLDTNTVRELLIVREAISTGVVGDIAGEDAATLALVKKAKERFLPNGSDSRPLSPPPLPEEDETKPTPPALPDETEEIPPFNPDNIDLYLRPPPLPVPDEEPTNVGLSVGYMGIRPMVGSSGENGSLGEKIESSIETRMAARNMEEVAKTGSEPKVGPWIMMSNGETSVRFLRHWDQMSPIFKIKITYMAVNGSERQKTNIVNQIRSMEEGDDKPLSTSICANIKKKRLNTTLIRMLLEKNTDTEEILKTYDQ